MSKNIASKDIYYNFTRILSYQSFIAMVIGGRGLGKTYGAKKLVIRDYFKSGAQFIYLRRYKTELKGINNFFSDVGVEFPEHEFRVHGIEAQTRLDLGDDVKDDDKPPWETMGYFLALSSAANKKSIAYPLVKRLIFDEFLMGKGVIHYLPNEYNALLELINTVDRNQDRVQVLMLSNNVDIANPYFLEFGITPHLKQIRKYRGGLVVVDFPDTGKYAEYAKRSRLGRLTEGTDYARYAIGNEAVTGASAYVRRKPGTSDYYFTIIHGSGSVSVWYNDRTLEWDVASRDVKKPNLFALTIAETKQGAVILEPSDPLVGMMKTAYRQRKMWFSSDQSHATFQGMLAFLNTK